MRRLFFEHDLAGFYYDSGNIGQALSMLKHVVAIRRHNLKQEDPRRLACEHLLARCVWKSGNQDEAVRILEDVVQHPKTCVSRRRSQKVTQFATTEGRIVRSLIVLGCFSVRCRRLLPGIFPERFLGTISCSGRIESSAFALQHDFIITTLRRWLLCV